MKPAATRLTVVLLLTVAVVGCRDPYANGRTARSAPSGTIAGDIDRPGPAAGAVPALPDGSAGSARAATRAFAARWINWDWHSITRQQRQLARLAAGMLRRELRSSARTGRLDASLARDKPGSRGTIVATELRVAGERARGLVVTREQTYTAGRADLGGSRHRVYLLKLVRGHNGWGVSAWQPQP